MGILLAAWQTFGLLVAERVFGAPESAKSLVAMAAAAGLLITPLTSFIFGRAKWRPSSAAGLVSILAAIFMFATAFAPNLGSFILTGFIGQIFLAQIGVLVIDIYAANYRASERGRRVSPPLMLASLIGGIFALGGGALLDENLALWRALYLLAGVSALVAAWLLNRMPSERLIRPPSLNPLANVHLAWSDSIFGLALLAWMLMGLGNLLTLPLRMEILANREYGFDATNFQVTLIFTLIPGLLQVVTLPGWAIIFDKLHFMIYRLLINLVILASIIIFFTAETLVGLSVSAVLHGLAMGGGSLAWNLWVTKLAPEGRAGAYMSVHTNFTGIRGLVAPALGFFLLTQTGRLGVIWTSGILIGLSVAIFTALLRHPRFRAEVV